MSKLVAAALLLVALAACVRSSGAMTLGPDTYRISAIASPARGGITAAQRRALDEAQMFCSQQQLEILVMTIATETVNSDGTADVNFRCLAKGDPDLVRPTYEKVPTTVIEDRRSR